MRLRKREGLCIAMTRAKRRLVLSLLGLDLFLRKNENDTFAIFGRDRRRLVREKYMSRLEQGIKNPRNQELKAAEA
jgi:hypothetical protein